MKIDFKQYESERLYPIGFKFMHKEGKKDAVEKTVTNYEITHAADGAVIRFEYVLQYDFMGQKISQRAVQTTIDIATNNGWRNL